MKKLLYLLLVVFSLSFLIGCEPQDNDKTTGTDVLTEVEGVDFSNVKFESITVTYDGLTHSIYVTNLPEGVSVAYYGNNVSEVGTHTVTAKFYKDNVIIHEMTATITIENKDIEDKTDFSTVVFEGIKVSYDGKSHSIYVENLSDDYTVTYEGNGVKEVGTHTVIAKIFDKDNNLVHEMTAVITIEKNDIEDNTDFTSVVFEGITVLYDGKSHSIYVVNLSDDYTVTYEGNGVKEVGTHTVIAKIFDNDNNLVHELTAIIKIVESSNVELPLV